LALPKKHAEKIRFGIVGVANTGLDFLILFLLVALGMDKIVANYISTGTAFIFSFFVNKSFTFKSSGGNAKKQFVLFMVITMTGLWVIQPILIAGVTELLGNTGWAPAFTLFVAKMVASVASLIWNYIFYSRFVFKAPQQPPEGTK